MPSLREINVSQVQETVARLFQEAATLLPDDVLQALRRGVGQGYTAGYLRASIVEKPFSARINTKDNTPPVVHAEIVPGDRLHIKVLPKGGGCENMSRFTIMLPGEGKKGITDFVLRTVEESGGNPCRPA